MTYSDYVKQFDTGLFTEMNKIDPFPWNDVYPPEQLDILFLYLHGNKPLITSISEIEITTLAKMIYTAYNWNWKKLFQAFTHDYEIGETYRIENENKYDRIESTENTKESTHSESAYNDTDLVVSDGSKDESADEHEIEDTRINKNMRTDFDTIQKNIDVMEKRLFTDTILKQVSEFINLKIYS